MPRSKNRPRAVTPQRSSWVDYFRWDGIPPTRLHEALQDGARQAGWTAPWELKDQKPQKKKAGKRSGISRGGRMEIRRSLVYNALRQLNPKHQTKPYSNTSLEALRRKYDHLLTRNADDPDPILSGILSALTPADLKALKRASDDTLLSDLKAIKRRHRTII
jgi:hypothetical protein